MANRIIITLQTADGCFRADFPVGLSSKASGFTLTSVGQRKIYCIKEIRNYTGKNLQQSKETSESLPYFFSEKDLSKGSDNLEEFAQALEAQGGTVERDVEVNTTSAFASTLLEAFTDAAKNIS